MHFFRIFSLPVILCLSISGCAWIDEVGEEDSSAELRMISASETLPEVLSCPADQFPIQFYYFDADEPFEGSARIRMYRSVAEALYSNQLTLNFEKVNADTLEDCPDPSTFAGQTFDITPNGCVRAYVQFNACDQKITARIQGTVTFDDYSTDRGDRVSGSIQGSLQFAEQIKSTTDTFERTTDIGTVEGEFSFVNLAGSIWRK